MNDTGLEEQQGLEYKAILEHAGIAIVFTCNRRVVRCNQRAEDLFGWPQGSLMGESGRVFYPDDAAYAELGARAGPILANGQTFETDIIFARRDGSRFFGHVIARAIDPLHAEAGTIWIASDVTLERMETETGRRLLREQQLIFERAQIGIMFSRDRRILRCNPRFSEILGYSQDELVGQLTRLFAPSEAAWIDIGERCYAAIAASGVFVSEELYIRRDGKPMWCHVTGSMLNPDDAEEGYVWLYEDITQRRQAMDALNAVMREQQLIFDRAQIGILFTRDRVVMRCNRRFEEILGYGPSELIGQSTRVYFPSDEAWQNAGHDLYAPISERGIFNDELLFRKKDGSPIWCHVTGSMLDPQRPEQGYVWLYEDVSEKRQAVDALNALVREQTLIFERARSGILFVKNRVIQRCNPRFAEIFGFRPDELAGQPTRIYHLDDDDFQAAGRRTYVAISATGSYSGDERYRRRDGETIWCHITGCLIDPAHPDFGHVFMFEDITEKRRATAALETLLREQTLIFERLHTGILFVRGRSIQRCNPRCAEIFGVDASALIGQSTRLLYATEAAWRATSADVQREFAAKGHFEGNVRFGRHDGSTVTCHVIGRVVDPADSRAGSVWLLEDITDRLAAEEALAQSHHEQQLIFDNAMIGISYQQNRTMLRCNRRMEEIFGHAPGSLVGKSTRVLFASDQAHAEAGALVYQAGQRDQTFDGVIEYCRADGTPIWVHVVGRTIDSESESQTWIWAYEDVSARRKAEKALLQSNREYELIFDNATIGISYMRDRIFIRCNRRLEEIFGFAPGGLVGQSARILFDSDEEYAETGLRIYTEAALAAGYTGEMNYRRNNDRTPIVVRISGRQITLDGESVWIWTYEDITARRNAEAALRQSNDEYSLIFENAMVGISYMRDRTFLRCNRQLETIFGFAPGALAGKSSRLLFASDDEWEATGRRVYAETLPGKGFAGEIRYTRQDGTPIWVRASGQPIREGDDEIWVWTHQDVTRRHVAEEALLLSHRELEAKVDERTAELTRQLHFMHQLIEAIPGPVFYKDTESRYLGLNTAFENFLGIPREQLKGARPHDIAPPELADKYLASDRALIDNPGKQIYEAQVRYADGSLHDVMFHKATFTDPDGSVGGIVGVMLDISERKQLEVRLQQAATVFDSTAEGVTITSTDGTIIAVNRAFTEITGYAEEEVIGRNPRLLQSGRQDESFYRSMWETIERSGRWQGELWNKRKDGRIFPEWLTISAVKDKDGKVIHYVGVFSDISAIIRAKEQLDYQAHHDPLTGLPNRLLLEDRLRGALQRARREQSSLAVLFVDLDRFKNINDTLGHHVGDRVLCEIAWRFGMLTRESDTVARLGGDEFLIVVEGIADPAAASRIADKILEDLSLNPITVDQEFFVGASIGISLFPQDGDDAATLMKHADIAMYRAKERGRNAYEFFTKDLTSFSLERFQMETGLRRAIDRDELRVFLQPQFSLATGKLVGAEALVRWQHPELGLVPPGKFIPLAEESGLIVPMGDWVQRHACACWAEWTAAGLKPGVLSINVSGIEFRRGRIQDSIRNALSESRLDPALLELEITESAIMSQAENSIQVLHELRTMGLSLAIDDFGTGYSSLAYLKRLPLNKLKVDQSFVRGLPEDAEDAAIARAVIALGHSLQLKVIAEGVETEAQRDFLGAESCDEMQGFLRGRPVPPDEFARLHLTR